MIMQGGYKLLKSPGEYTVLDILVHTEGELAPVACLERDKKNAYGRRNVRLFPYGKGSVV